MTGRNSKSGKGGLRTLKKWHKWFSIILSLFIIVFAASGIILNHRDWFSSVDISRAWMPKEYRYNNWNLAAIKGSTAIGDTILVYGNIGVWKSTDNFLTVSDFNIGFPPGIDNRKISRVLQTGAGTIYSGTFFGLYQWNGTQWEKCLLPVKEERITDLAFKDGLLYVLTRSNLLVDDDTKPGFDPQLVKLPLPEDYEDKAGLFETLWTIHSGEIYGLPGKLFVDLMGLAFIFLTMTGLLLWLFPGLIRKMKKKQVRVTKLVHSLKFSLKWHNRIGYYFSVFLILTTLTGMFLRPPLLIAIASARVAKIPYTILDNVNPWHDKMRAIHIDKQGERMILNTSDGFYYCKNNLKSPLKKFETQPPVSVMGITVFEQVSDGGFIVGSFSGLYAWYPDQNTNIDLFASPGSEYPISMGRPVSDHAITGMVWDNDGKPFVFDFVKGVSGFKHDRLFLEMPEKIISGSPMSLWNVALEFHTARIYRALTGELYILIIPLAGLSILFIIISGFYLYWKLYRRNVRTPGNKNADDSQQKGMKRVFAVK